jgi:hypothetical protein
MSLLTRKTAQLLCARAGIARKELTEEAQKLYDLYEDPAVNAEQKAVVKVQLDDLIKRLEERVTTRMVKRDLPDQKP